MNLKETIKKVLQETEEEKLNKYINHFFDKVFDKLNLKVENNRNAIYGKWFNEKNIDVFHRNDWGVLWVTECEAYRTLRSYSRVLGLDFNTFQKVLVEYLNNKYKEEFFDKPIKKIGDEHLCIEEKN